MVTKVGRTKHLRIMPGGALEQEGSSSVFVGQKLDEHRGAFVLEYPMDKGTVIHWDAMERIWDVSTKQHGMSLDYTLNHPYLLLTSFTVHVFQSQCQH